MFSTRSIPTRRKAWSALTTLLLGSVFSVGQAQAASTKGCEGGGFTVLTRSGTQDTTVPAGTLGSRFRVQGKYVQFDVDTATLGVRNYMLTGAPNALDMTGGVLTPVFESKLPDHRGLSLTSDLELALKDENFEIGREGPGLVMKVQAKDCASGGVFQMEVERTDGSTTLFTHTLASQSGNLQPFYFDNRHFRDREGDTLPYKDTTVVVSARINFGNDFSRKFVGRDSPQVATRVPAPGCVNSIVTRTGSIAKVSHCGAVSQWQVASGGRMGMVFGEDATEVAPPATVCVKQCQAQNRVRGRATTLGFPFPVSSGDRLQPRLPQ